jgi:hypothetical protein
MPPWSVVCDREGDIYDLFPPPLAFCHRLVRAAQDHNACGGGLLAHAMSLPEQQRATVEIGASPDRNATPRLPSASIPCALAPVNAPKAGLPDETAVQLVAVREIDPPAGVEPVCWVLITTHAVQSPKDALQIVDWYRKRWLIEQLFRCLKTQGFNVEESQLAEGHALMNLTTAALIAAMQTLQLTMARNAPACQPIGDVFGEREVRVLAAIERELPGKTAKQSNPHPPGSLPWAAWIVARLGGWTGYASQKPPGPKTIYLGLAEFEAIARGWLLCQGNV